MNNLKRVYFKCRKYILNSFIPEIVWPKSINFYSTNIAIRGMPYSFGVKFQLLKKKYEFEETFFINKYLKSGDKVFEMGASIGICTRLILDKIGVSGRLISVEASQELHKQNEIYFKGYSNVNYLLGLAFPVYNIEKSQYCNSKFIFDGTSLGGFLSFDKIDKIDNINNIYDIKTVQDLYIVPNVLIIDIEGSEITLLEKNAMIPDFVELIIIELHPNMYNLETTLKIKGKINDFGFSLIDKMENVYCFKRDI